MSEAVHKVDRMSADKSAWQVPASWWRPAHAFHGRGPCPKVRLVASASAEIDKLLERTAEYVSGVLAHPATPDHLAAAAREFLDARTNGGIAPVLGAAVIWKIAPNYSEYRVRVLFVDDLVGRFGVAFAARAAVLGAGLSTRYHQPSHETGTATGDSVDYRSDTDLNNEGIYEPHNRLRSMIAALDDAEYAALRISLDALRGTVLTQNFTASFLFPTEEQWLLEDFQAVSALDNHDYQSALPLVTCATTLAQVEKFFDLGDSRDDTIWMFGMRMDLVYSLCANNGPGSEHLVAEVFDGNVSAQNKKKAASILAQFDTDRALELLLDRLGRKYIEPAIREAMSLSPERTARVLAQRQSTPAVAELLRDHLKVHSTLVNEVAELRDNRTLSGAEISGPELVPANELPPLLADPPWNQRRPPRPPALMLTTPPRPLTTAWSDGEQQEWEHDGDDFRRWFRQSWDEIVTDIAAGRPTHCFDALAHAPSDMVRPFISDHSLLERYWNYEHHLRRILGRFDTAAAPLILQAALNRPVRNAHLLLPIDGSAVCEQMMRWLGSKIIRPTAQTWFDRHITTAATDVVVAALGARGPEQSRAERALHELQRQGHRSALIAAAHTLGSAAEDAVCALLDADPLTQLPPRIPTLPDWVNPVLLQPVTLRGDSRALPERSILNICTMFALSRPDDAYAGIDILRELVDPDSLADMAWSLFERWSDIGFPNAQGWVLDALGLVGNDNTARNLTPLILTWPLQSAHRRAGAGLEVLANIGTDAALGALWRISQGLRFPALREKATQRISTIADELGLTPLELADRLVPDLGLDDNGTTVFDYGSHIFQLSLDEKLRPLIVDADDKPRPRLPRPGPNDSADAAAEYKRYTTLRKDLSALAPELISRLEHAMIAQRQWTMAQLRQHLLDHPLMWQLCSRVIWSTVGSADQPARTFLVSQLRTPVGVDGTAVIVDNNTAVVLAHPVNLGTTTSQWAHALERLGLRQPFEQVERAVSGGPIEPILGALAGMKTPTRELLALKAFGWIREDPQDRGAQISLSKMVDGDRFATIMVFPGFNAANALEWDEQKIIHAFVCGDPGAPPLSPITLSELARDIATVDVQPITGTESDFDGAPE